MSSLNEATLIGNVGRDPEIRSMQNGERCATLSLATSETWRDKQSGERREATEWHRVVIFNQRLVDLAERFVKKGGRIFLRGMLKTRKWTDNSNVERYTTEIVLTKFGGEIKLLDRRQGGDGGSGDDEGTEDAGTQQRPPAHHPDLDDDIPF